MLWVKVKVKCCGHLWIDIGHYNVARMYLIEKKMYLIEGTIKMPHMAKKVIKDNCSQPNFFRTRESSLISTRTQFQK